MLYMGEVARVRWLTLAAWCALCLWARGKYRAALFGAAYTLAVALSMLTQLRLLHADGMLSLSTALPLHLCSLMGVLSPLIIWRSPAWLYELSYFLGAPCALATLLFPAMVASSRPALMAAAFYRLHALVALAPVYARAQGKPLPTDPRRAFVIGNGYLLLVSAVNRLLDTNYLFLRYAPVGTPLEWLARGGGGAYILALELLCMLLMRALASMARAIEGNRRACTPCSRRSAPCTTPPRARGS